MTKPIDITGTFFKMRKDNDFPFEEYTVIIGFSGWGNVGYLSVNHLIETLDVRSFAGWGTSSWFYKGNLESIVTAYVHEESKTILIVSRVPIPVTHVSPNNWDMFATEVLSWNCKRYIIVGGLREETRTSENNEWIVMAPNNAYREEYNTELTFGERLAMIGPLSSFLTIGTSLDVPVLGLLTYCNFEEDPEAAVIVLDELEKIIKHTIPRKLRGFDYTFVPMQESNNEDALTALFSDDDEEPEDYPPGYDPDDLL